MKKTDNPASSNEDKEVPNFALMGAIPNFIPPKIKPEDKKKPPRSRK